MPCPPPPVAPECLLKSLNAVENAISPQQLCPRNIEGLEDFPVTALAGGLDHTLALSSCGAVFTIGSGYRDTCRTGGAPTLGRSVASATTTGVVGEQDGIMAIRVTGDAFCSTPVIMIASGWYHCMAVTDDGALFSWGSGREGQLGHGDVGEVPREGASMNRHGEAVG